MTDCWSTVLLNGLNFDIDTRGRYPALAELLVSLPEERPEEYEDYHDKPFLTRWDAEWAFRWAITREPLELIAHVVMNDLSYQQVVTADHTMVNAFSDLAYRSDTGFSHDFSDASGFYDRSEYRILSPVITTGIFPMINSSNLTKTATSKLQRISGVAARGRAFHAGVARSLSLYRHQSQSSSSEMDLLSLFRGRY